MMACFIYYRTGNQVVDTLTYSDTTHLLKRQYATKGSTIIRDYRYSYNGFLNLASRTEVRNATPMTETFKYDNLDRLDTIAFNNTSSVMAYDAYGRMTRRTSEGVMVFQNARYDNQSRPHAVLGADVNSTVFPGESQIITYTMHDKVKTIQQDNDLLTIDYGYDKQRIGMTDYNYGLQTTTSKLYVGSCEFNRGVSRPQRLTYISGPLGVFAVYEELGELYKGDGDDDDDSGGDDPTDSSYTGALYYVYRDHLGSVTAITDATGSVVQELSYDAWGNLRNPNNWSIPFTGTPKFDRGYTGHEHLTRYGLINMKFTLSESSAKLCLSTAERSELGEANGRMYDPVMSSFLSVDRFLQNPSTSQGFNRYAYCMYNPLRYVDPTGFYMTSGNRHHPDDPPHEIIDGQVVFWLPEVTITPYDEPPVTVNESPYPNTTSGGGSHFDWSDLVNNNANGSTIGQGGGVNIGYGPNHNTSDNQGFLPEMAPIISYEGIVIGYKQKQWQNPASRAQKALNQKKAYEIQKTLKSKGVSKHVKDIKAGKVSNLKTLGIGGALVNIGIEGVDIYYNQELNISNCINLTMAGFGVLFWEVSLAYLIIDVGCIIITGNTIGQQIDEWYGNPLIDFKQ